MKIENSRGSPDKLVNVSEEADSVAVVPPVASLVYFVDEVHHKTQSASYLAAHRR